MKKDLLLVIDMQNVYLPDEPWGCASMNESIQNIQLLLDQPNKSYDVIFTEYLPAENPIGVWKDYNEVNKEIIENDWMNEIVEDLKPYTKQYPVYQKSIYSSMKIPEILAASTQCDHIVLSGVVSECCVLATCLEAVDLGYSVIFLKDACSGFNDETEQAVLTALAGLMPLHIQAMTTEEYLKNSGC